MEPERTGFSPAGTGLSSSMLTSEMSSPIRPSPEKRSKADHPVHSLAALRHHGVEHRGGAASSVGSAADQELAQAALDLAVHEARVRERELERQRALAEREALKDQAELQVLRARQELLRVSSNRGSAASRRSAASGGQCALANAGAEWSAHQPAASSTAPAPAHTPLTQTTLEQHQALTTLHDLTSPARTRVETYELHTPEEHTHTLTRRRHNQLPQVTPSSSGTRTSSHRRIPTTPGTQTQVRGVECMNIR